MPVLSQTFALPGFRLFQGELLNKLASLFDLNSSGALTATAGGTRPLAVKLVNGVNHIAVCATNADSVVLPAAKRGSVVPVFNHGAADATVYGAGADTINATAGSTGVTLAAGKSAIYICGVDAKWGAVLSA